MKNENLVANYILFDLVWIINIPRIHILDLFFGLSLHTEIYLKISNKITSQATKQMYILDVKKVESKRWQKRLERLV